MDKFEYKVRADEIKQLIADKEYEQAAEIADTINWSHVKKAGTLCTISDLYKKNRRFDDALELLQMAYDRCPGSKDIVYNLCELYLITGDFIQAIESFKEFKQVAPKDNRRYLLQYKIYEAQDISLEERIEVLEEYKSRQYEPKWGYTLAYLYHRMGLATKCVEECDELILFFNGSVYATKAMELKALHAPLSTEQQAQYDHRFSDPSLSVGDHLQLAQEQAAVASETEMSGGVSGDTIVVDPISQEKLREMGYDSSVLLSNTQDTAKDHKITEEEIALSFGHTRVYHGMEEEQDIQVHPIDVGEYNTLNLQRALAAEVQDVLQDSDTGALSGTAVGGAVSETEPTRVISEEEIQNAMQEQAREEDGAFKKSILSTMFSDTQQMDLSDLPSIEEEQEEKIPMASEVFFGMTGEMKEVRLPQENAQENVQEYSEKNLQGNQQGSPEEEALVQEVEQALEEEQDYANKPLTEPLFYGAYSKTVQEAIYAQPPEPMAQVLHQEPDGQIRLVVPEDKKLDQQITGQLNISDVMYEWERMKRETEERNRRQFLDRVKQQTGEMFNEFETAVLNGMLETLEKENTDEMAKSSKELTEVEVNTDDYFGPGEENATYEDVIGPEDTVEELEEILDPEELDEMAISIAAATVEAVNENERSESEQEQETVLAMAKEVAQALSKEADEETASISEEAGEGIDESEGREETFDDIDDSEDEEETEGDIDDSEEMEASSEEDVSEEEKDSDESDSDNSDEEDSSTEEDAEDLLPIAARELTKEEKELFGAFIQSRSARTQLVMVLDGISMASYTGNVILTGDEGADTTNLATTIMKDVKQCDSNFTGKVARISGSNLNGKRVADTIQQLSNGALIIEKAEGMNDDTALALQRSLEQDNLGIIVTLIDTSRNMKRLLRRQPALGEMFTARMHVKALSGDQLVAFAKRYAYELEYSIDIMGALALHRQIDARQTNNHAVNVIEVKEMVDNAIRHVKKKNMSHFFDVAFGKRYDKEDMIILSEKDFEF